MTKNEYYKIVYRRGSFRKKGLLYVLSSFFDIAHISHDEVNKIYIIPTHLIANLSFLEMKIFSKLIGQFSIYDYLDNNCLIIKYNFL